MATGRMFPRPGRYGLSSAQIASKVTTTIVVAEPISIACERFSSAESAKKSMKTKTMRRSTEERPRPSSA